MKLLRYVIAITLIIALAFALTACDIEADEVDASATDVKESVVEEMKEDNKVVASLHNPGESITDWNVALAFLQEGNARHVANRTISRDDFGSDRDVLKDAQKPFASIVTCADSRVAPELYFDQKSGDIFVVRNAGNIADTTAMGSLEFSVAALEVPLIVVVGHSSCGAVKGTIAGGEYPAALQSILDFIAPGIAGIEDLDEATIANVEAQVKNIQEDEIVKSAGTKVIGAIYDIGTGKITWL